MTDLYKHKWTRRDLARYVGSIDQVAGIKPFEATDGVERGGPARTISRGASAHPALSWTAVRKQGICRRTRFGPVPRARSSQ